MSVPATELDAMSCCYCGVMRSLLLLFALVGPFLVTIAKPCPSGIITLVSLVLLVSVSCFAMRYKNADPKDLVWSSGGRNSGMCYWSTSK